MMTTRASIIISSGLVIGLDISYMNMAVNSSPLHGSHFFTMWNKVMDGSLGKEDYVGSLF
jgi:hypothetical protein